MAPILAARGPIRRYESNGTLPRWNLNTPTGPFAGRAIRITAS
jgi:hypothetical protein